MQNEIQIRLLSFFTIFFVMALWELWSPARELTLRRSLRWRSNLGLVVLNSLILRLSFPISAVWLSSFCADQRLGLFNLFHLPFALELIVSVILFDLAIYGQHFLFHKLPFLWRFHKVHHADIDFDVSTGNRFHTVEIILSMLIKFGFILLLGPSALAVLAFEIILNGMAMFNHANIELPAKLDRYLRKIFVTPNMHRIHHSTRSKEHHRNFGFNLSIWDRLFRTYLNHASESTKLMRLGLEEFREPKDQRLRRLLLIPFLKVTKVNEQHHLHLD